jgi:hypothetical protein
MENNYTSLWLSKKLKEGGCELESSCKWCNGKITKSRHKHWYIESDSFNNNVADIRFYSYDIMNDICVKYAREFFPTDYTREIFTKNILKLMQKGNKEYVEIYIWNHCVFNNESEEN